MMIEILGWTATAVFVSSYLFRTPAGTRRVQMLGALLWMTYGALLGAPPVVVANVLVFVAAAWTAMRRDSTPSAARVAADPGEASGRRFD